ncbi:peptidase [Rhodococcus sp. 15-725-2-2b]|uniref:M23 family metallopeptidase n=1 Tax=unclassified Rhodococcus (in: high G+C Gram-positive bacteria) TaxID=192944 RepID=UPI000B9B67AA|nr:peptidase [Rhodococcus sp. 06-470-2]OZC71856.1 peptidase [Rhodococcus sp. 06-469-3-2]OZC82744.1 peptidase [Rhodococcus sp. 06-418-5]OZD42646.1 peptidase [Rhodococcus sp. 06-1477-1A]OZE06092.1 peptidase [Rhodococcus sp. 05-2255-3B1]OZE09301.1 peptidase [Rhodococcus sp. 05-2255-3C]OZE18245.1 peptidase [Rhodococcus sp. 05-2255-2A2]OZE55770.1 peptidase [Rhodococcus sp. 05-2221-1B]OZE68351.1 peptidase [Rhodococcus sp. 15-725-2-2b]OZF26755.1 peptidase [Rhodococcus sp. 14-2496-1d]
MNVCLPRRTFAVCLATAVALSTPVASAQQGAFAWPLQPRPQVVTPFDRPEQNWLPGHRGVDLAAPEGRSVLAVADGTVVFAGSVAGKPVVSVDHPGGLRSTYEPVVASVAAGARVRRGTVLGSLASGHESCPSTCLHWGVRRGREYLDPTALVRVSPIRLKPLDEDGR